MHSSLQTAQVPRPPDVGGDAPPLAPDVVRQFFAKPYGPHGVELQSLLNRMRAAPVASKLVLLVVTPHREWQLARLPQRRGEALSVLPGPSFMVLADAERAAFRLRWKEMFGWRLPDEVASDV